MGWVKTWVKAHYEQAMLFVSFVEVVLVFGRVFFGALLFQNSFVPSLSYEIPSHSDPSF